MQHDFEDIIRRIRLRDQSALEELIDETRKPVLALIEKHSIYLATEEDIQETAQDTYVTVWNDIDKFDPNRSSFLTWIGMIATYQTFYLNRSLRKRESYETLGLHDFEENIPDHVKSFVDKIEDNQEKDILKELLVHLSLEEMNLLEMRVSQELTYEEISRILNLSSEALRKRMSRIVIKLKYLYKKLYNDEEYM